MERHFVLLRKAIAMKSRNLLVFSLLVFLTLVLFCYDLCIGSVKISLGSCYKALFWHDESEDIVFIVRNIRLVKACVAIIAGAALSCAGLQLQSLFRNPLAGPYTLGVSSGASLGVALFVLGNHYFNYSFSPFLNSLGYVGAGLLGSVLILILISSLSSRIRDIMVILILGIMFSSISSAIIQVLQFYSNEDALKSYVIWTMGSLGELSFEDFWILLSLVGLGLLLSILLIKPLNILLLGENYAKNMGLNVKLTRNLIFASSTILAGGVTAFCGPIGFIGMAMPHMARLILNDANHLRLLPCSILCGSIALLICDIFSKLLALPINTISSLLGIPIVIWIVLKSH